MSRIGLWKSHAWALLQGRLSRIGRETSAFGRGSLQFFAPQILGCGFGLEGKFLRFFAGTFGRVHAKSVLQPQERFFVIPSGKIGHTDREGSACGEAGQDQGKASASTGSGSWVACA